MDAGVVKYALPLFAWVLATAQLLVLALLAIFLTACLFVALAAPVKQVSCSENFISAGLMQYNFMSCVSVRAS